MNGYQILYEMKNHELLRDIPVIFITALDKTEDEERGLVMGAVDYIPKPFNHAIVLARVNNHIKIVRQRKVIENIALLDGLTEIPNGVITTAASAWSGTGPSVKMPQFLF